MQESRKSGFLILQLWDDSTSSHSLANNERQGPSSLLPANATLEKACKNMN